MCVLGIETSCDETGVAVYDEQRGLLANIVYSQIPIHAPYGGVVPELASRDHVRKTLPLVREVVAQAGLTLQDIDGIAYTAGPGLVGALLVGAVLSKSLAFALNIPSIAVHHMEAHLLAPFLSANPPQFPFIALLVSGGHTQLVQVEAIGNYNILGESIDDAAGEAFDKVAKILGLEYPGGPQLAKLAEKGKSGRFHFPRPMVDRPGLDFSFSGLKTAAFNLVREQVIGDFDEQTKADIALAFQDAVVDTLALKCRRALRQTGLHELVVAGGVSANVALRHKLDAMAKEERAAVYYPALEFCTDNGAMIAYAGSKRLALQKDIREDLRINVFPRWEMEKQL